MNTYNPERIKLNTIELEEWLAPFWDVNEFCNQKINWDVLDLHLEDFFSIQSKKLVFWVNYKEYVDIKVTQIDWSIVIKKIPTIINWWMWTNVSSPSLVAAMNELWFGWHLSSVWIGPYYYDELYPHYFNFSENDSDNKTQEEKKELNNELKDIVQKDFDELFKEKLGLSDDLIEKHFFICNDLWENEKNKWFNWENWKGRLIRMMDLVAIYNYVTKLKDEWNNVWINSMLKTSSYIAALKMSCLVWMDYVTTAAWNPTENPKVFLKNFFNDLTEKNINFSIPAFWLLVSTWRGFNDFDYDYYIFEEWAKAWGHVIREKKDKFESTKKIKELFKKKWKDIPPFLAAWWVNSNADIKRVLDNWYDGAQLWTVPAVSEQACGWKWNRFKRRLIWWNHLWPRSEIDEEFKQEWENALKWSESIISEFNKKILDNLSEDNWLEYSKETPEIKRVRDYLYKIVYSDFFDEKVEELNDNEEKIYNQIRDFIFSEYGWDIKKINKVLRDYWNAMKFVKWFNKFVEENDSNPTHLVFDSTVWFPWRMKIIDNVFEIVTWNIKSSWCVNCLTDCILAWRWSIREDRGSKFCIFDRLNYLQEERNMVFSWRSTVPYDEIRPLKDLMAYFMWTYVVR